MKSRLVLLLELLPGQGRAANVDVDARARPGAPARDRQRAGERAWTVLTAYTRGVVFVATVDAVLIGAALLIIGVPLALR